MSSQQPSPNDYRWALEAYQELNKELKQKEREINDLKKEIVSLKAQVEFQEGLNASLLRRWQLTEARLFRVVDGKVSLNEVEKYILYVIKAHKVPF